MTEEYSKLIELIKRFNEHTDGSMTHINRSNRIAREIASTNYLLAKAIAEVNWSIPPDKFENIKDSAIKMSLLLDEFADFLQDYGEDLVKIGTDIADIFLEFGNCMERK